MKELIKVSTNQQGEQVVSARDLHEFLVKDANGGQTGEMFAHWMNRVLEYGFVEGVDFETIEFDYVGNPIAKNSKSDSQQVRVHKREFALTINAAKEIAMIQRNDKGKQARQYFIECEKQLKQSQAQPVALPSVKELALMVVKAEEEKERLIAENAKLAPKAEYTEKVLTSQSQLTTTEIAKELRMSAQALNKILCERGVQYKHRGHYVLTSRFQDKGYTTLNTFQYEDSQSVSRTSHHMVWTEAGRAYIHKLVNSNLSYSIPAREVAQSSVVV